jgi:hypothetical protein
MLNAYIVFTLLLSLSSTALSKEIDELKTDQDIYEYKYLKIITDTINNLIYCFVEEKPGRSDQPAIYSATLINLF